MAANLEAWTVQVKREKAIYHTLNKLSVDVTRKVLVAEAWCPTSGTGRVQQALQQVQQLIPGSVSSPSASARAQHSQQQDANNVRKAQCRPIVSTAG